MAAKSYCIMLRKLVRAREGTGEDSWEGFLSFSSQMHWAVAYVWFCKAYINYTARRNRFAAIVTELPLFAIQIGFLSFNVPFNAVSPNPVHR